MDGMSMYAQVSLHHDRLRPHAHLRQASGWPRACPALPCACLEHTRHERRWSVAASTSYRACQDSAATAPVSAAVFLRRSPAAPMCCGMSSACTAITAQTWTCAETRPSR